MLIRTYADIEKLEGEDALSEAERTLIENCTRGESTVLGDGSLPDGPSPERTIRAGLLRYLILGGCDIYSLHERGVILGGAWIQGRLDLSFAQAKAFALNRCIFDNAISALQTRFKIANLAECGLCGLDASGSATEGYVCLDRVSSSKKISFSDSEIGGAFLCRAVNLDCEEERALILRGVTLRGGLFLRNSKINGEIYLSAARIFGPFIADLCSIIGANGRSLTAENVDVNGEVCLRESSIIGTISFSGAVVGGGLELKYSKIEVAEGVVLGLEGCNIKGCVYLEGLKSRGEISFSGAEIGSQLIFDGADLDGGEGTALLGQRLVVKGSVFWRTLKSVKGEVNFNAARLGDLVDDMDGWNQVSKLSLVGGTYDNLVGPADLSFRKSWVLKGSQLEGQFHPQPYQQLAKFYRDTGHRYEAREILVAKEIEQRKATRKAIREGKARTESWLHPTALALRELLWDWATRLIAGYGYKPWLSLWWLGGMVVAMMLCAQLTWNAGDFAPNSAVILTSQDWKTIADGPSGNPAADWTDALAPGKDYETFYSFAYALDVVVPVLDLGQTDAWAPSPARGDAGKYLFYAQKMFIILGWVVTAIAAAAISGMIRRDD